MKKYLLLLFATLALAACSGNDDDAPVAATPAATSPPDVTPPSTGSAPVADSFTAGIVTTVSASDETSEPVSVDAITASSPEDTEPVPIS